jgi:hypothetical protein
MLIRLKAFYHYLVEEFAVEESFELHKDDRIWLASAWNRGSLRYCFVCS